MTESTGRDGRRVRRVLAFTLAFSLLLHVTVGGVWTGFAHRVASAVARYLPRPKPTPSEIVVTSDTITITRQTVPRQSHRTPPHARPQRPAPAQRPAPRVPAQRPAPNAVAQRPLPRTVPVPTLAPLPARSRPSDAQARTVDPRRRLRQDSPSASRAEQRSARDAR